MQRRPRASWPRGGEERARDADAQTGHALLEIGAIIGDRNIGAGGVLRVVSGEHLKRDRGILDAAGQRSDVIQRP